MYNIELLTLIALLIKHWYIDFVNQTTIEVRGKGSYGNIHGIMHSLKHGLFTSFIFVVIADPMPGLLIGFLDFILHYHIDWIKMNFGNQNINDKKFWNHLGLDQLAHQLCYIFYISDFI